MTGCPELDSLDAEEQELAARIARLRASRDSADSEQRIFARYREIHRAYESLLTRPECADESLKRAVFIQWFMAAEPPYLSGIDGLDESSMRKVLAELEHRAATERCDQELIAMLVWYFNVAAWAFPSRAESPHLHAVVNAHSNPRPQVQRPLSERGQMGRYWNSLNRGD